MRGDGYDDLDDFFGRPRGGTAVADRPRPAAPAPRSAPAGRSRSAKRPAPAAPAPRGRRSATPTSSPRPAPASGATRSARRAPGPRNATVTPPAVVPRPSRARGPRPGGPSPARARARAPRPAPAPRPARVAPPALSAGQVAARTRRRLIGLAVGLAVLVAGVSARLVDAQVLHRSTYENYGEQARDGYRVLPAGRGAIYDRAGHAFALSVSQPNVVADPASVRGPVRTARILAPILGLPVDEVARKLEHRGTRYALLLETAPTKTVKAVKAAIEEHHLDGISFEDRYVRRTPSGDLARSLVGSTYADGEVDDEGRQGKTGLEKAYDHRLEGVPGKVSFERARWGSTIAGTPERVHPAKPGTDLYLTLDQSLQYGAERALSQQVAAMGAEQGMAIISRPSTGEVLAMASVATNEDGTVSVTGDNRPVSTQFEPGSVNKMITVAGAFEDGVVTPDTPIVVPDHYTLYDKTFTDHDPHPTATWSPTDILVTSSNIGTIKIADMLSKQRVQHYLRAFGFGSSSGAFPGEIDGELIPLKDWSGTSAGAIPIGQGISVTALQMLAAYNVIANDGVYVTPKLVAATDDGSGKVASARSAGRRVVSPETARAVRQILAQVVTDGTGKSAAVPGYVAYGKTGTARIPQPPPHADPHDAYQDAAGRYHYESTFVGGVEGADLSIIVSIQDAKASIFGGTVSAPVFAQLASLALRHEQIPPPALVGAPARDVPALSQSAKGLDGEDAGRVTPTTQG